MMLGVFMILWKLRLKPARLGTLFGIYLIFAGVERFLIEFVRAKDDRFLAGFTIAQLTSTFVVLVGVGVWLSSRDAPDPDPGPYLVRV
jgi:phosphatidylglycerol:prolipoprotein diacylglycerol transferase